MNVMLSRILLLAAVSGLLLLTAASGQSATVPPTNGPARVDASPERVEKSSKRTGGKSRRSDGNSKRSDSSSRTPATSPKREASSLGGTDYASFKMIGDRNIFSASRSGSGGKAPIKVEYFSLAGVLGYEKGTYAFFDGSSAEYRKVLKPEGTIAGFKITEIAPSAAKLAAGEQTVELHVGGMQLRREDEGEWKLAARTDVPSSPDNGYARDRSSTNRDSGSRFGSDRGSSSRFSGGDRGSSRFGGGDRGSSRFGGGRGSGGGSPGDRSSNGRDSGSRFSDNRESNGTSSGGQSPGGSSRDEVLRRLMEQRAR